MKILIHDYAGHAFPVHLSRHLAKRGHTVTHAFAGGLITPRGFLSVGPDDPIGFTVKELAMSAAYRKNKYNFIKRRHYEAVYGDDLGAFIRELEPDVIVSGNTPSEPQWKAVKAARKAGIPFISWVQDIYSVAVDRLARERMPIVGALAGSYYKWLDRQCLTKSAGVISITGDFNAILADFGVPADAITVIPNWAPMNELPLRPKLNHWSTAQGVEGKFVYLYSGTLAMKHNPDLILNLARHFKFNPEVVVIVISEGPGADYLARRKTSEALTGLTVLPFQPFHVMPNVLGTADVMLAVLDREAGLFSVPSKVLTYHAAGKAIVAAIPGENLAARIIKAETSGLCVEPEDQAGFVAKAVDLFKDAPLRQRLGASGRAYAEREFNIDKIGHRFEAILRGAVSL